MNFKDLIPWKRPSGQISVRHDEPTRESDRVSHPLSQMREEFDSLMTRFLDDHWMGSRWFKDFPSLPDDSRFDWNWDLGWEDNGSEFVFHAEAPGFEPEDFDIKISGNMLTVHAEHQEEKKEGNGSGYRYGSFTRTCPLPHGGNDAKVDARYRNGILELHLPKTEDVKTRKIEVKPA